MIAGQKIIAFSAKAQEIGEIMPFSLHPVTEADAPFLYELLKQRPAEANISHRAMPTYHEHVAFIQSKPYDDWRIILDGDLRIGSVYLTAVSVAPQTYAIGVFVLKSEQGNGAGSWAVQQMLAAYPNRRIVANIAPVNLGSQRFFERLGFRLVQHTYEAFTKKDSPLNIQGSTMHPFQLVKEIYIIMVNGDHRHEDC